MKQTVNFSQFTSAFHNMGRGDQFSYNGLKALFNFLEDMESQLGEEHELDVIALCCDFSEYESEEDLLANCSDCESLEDVHDNTMVIEVDGGGYIIQNF